MEIFLSEASSAVAVQFDWQNVINGDGIGITITGMLIVFCGLILISLYIAYLPRALALLDRDKDRKREKARGSELQATAAPAKNEGMDPAIIAVATFVIERELERLSGAGDLQMTITRQPPGRAWAIAGKMRTLSRDS